MKPFKFQKFTIDQSKKVFAVGTDGVLLGALCNCKIYKNILEIGTGTGLISLMIAQRNIEAKISAIDVSHEAKNLAEKNFAESPFYKNISVKQENIANIDINEKYDMIVCNPPFFEANDSKKHIFARQQITLSYDILIQKAAEILTKSGLLSVIVPSKDRDVFIENCKSVGLHLHRNIHVFGIKNGKKIRNILEFGLIEKICINENFIIEKSPRQYSEQYLEATKDFHCFGNSVNVK